MQTITFTHIECGECGGTFGPDTTTSNPDAFVCESGHERHSWDFLPNMDEGETLTVHGGVLGYITEEV